MNTATVTGSYGLIGIEVTAYFARADLPEGKQI
jgi:hypothetical protein